MRPVDAREEELQQLNDLYDAIGDVRDFGGFKGIDDTSASLLRR